MSQNASQLIEGSANTLLAFSFFGLFTEFFGWVGTNHTTLVGTSAILGGMMYVYKMVGDAYDRRQKMKNGTLDKGFKKMVDDKKRELAATAHKNGTSDNFMKDKK